MILFIKNIYTRIHRWRFQWKYYCRNRVSTCVWWPR